MLKYPETKAWKTIKKIPNKNTMKNIIKGRTDDSRIWERV